MEEPLFQKVSEYTKYSTENEKTMSFILNNVRSIV